MNIDFTMEFIRSRMSEISPGKDFTVKLRHLVLFSNEVRKLNAENQVLMLTEPTAMVRIESATGFFDLSANTANELQYEHQGHVTITNLSALPTHVRFIQAVPKK